MNETTSTKPNNVPLSRKLLAVGAAIITLGGVYEAVPSVHTAINTAVANAEGNVQTPDILNGPHKVVDATPNADTVYDIAVEAAGKDGNIRATEDEITKALGGDTNIYVGEPVPVPEDSVVGKPVGPLNG